MKRVLISIAISGTAGLLIGWLVDVTFGIVVALMLVAVLPILIQVIANLNGTTDEQTINPPEPNPLISRRESLNKALGLARKLRLELESKLEKDKNAVPLKEEIHQIEERERKITEELNTLNKRNKG